MKKIFLSLILCFIGTLTIFAEEISSIDCTGTWIYLYNAKGKKYKTLSVSSAGTVVGYSSTFFVTVSSSGTWIHLYNADGRKITTLSSSNVGDVIGVAGDTFTSRKGSWIYTWSKEGKKLNTRSAN